MKKRYSILLFSSLVLFGCQYFEKNTESPLIDVQTKPKHLSLFGENVISTPLYERDIAISPKGDELIYTLGDYKQNKRCLVVIKKQNKKWRKSEILNISGKYQDIEPFLTNNGNRLFFASNRPIYGDISRNDYNIWYSDKIEGTWSEPIALDSVINTRGNEFFPSLSKNGNLYFTSSRENGIGSEDIFMSKFSDGKFHLPLPLPVEINSTSFEFNAYISPDENLLIFSSFGREDCFGGGDLYISQKDHVGKWEKAKNMGELINSDKLDYCPFIDWKSGNFYFTSERITMNSNIVENIETLKHSANSVKNGFGNIYKIGISKIENIN